MLPQNRAGAGTGAPPPPVTRLPWIMGGKNCFIHGEDPRPPAAFSSAVDHPQCPLLGSITSVISPQTRRERLEGQYLPRLGHAKASQKMRGHGGGSLDVLPLGRSRGTKASVAAFLLINALRFSSHCSCQEPAFVDVIHFPLNGDLSALFLGIHTPWGC